MLSVGLDFHRWRRVFRQPWATAHEVWTHREGLLLRARFPDGSLPPDGHNAAYGTRFAEVAPLPFFGTETLAEAVAVLEGHREAVAEAVAARWTASRAGSAGLPSESLPRYPSEVGPALRWALDGLGWGFPEAPLGQTVPSARVLPGLLSADLDARLGEAWAEGWRVFKLKIRVGDPSAELAAARELVRRLPPGGRLRLDANGGLDAETWRQWAKAATSGPGAPWPLDYLEQPLPPGQEAAAAAIAAETGAPWALDESVAQLPALADLAARYPTATLVVKPSLLGDLPGFLAWRAAHLEATLVYSSALETGLGQMVTRHLAARDQGRQLAAGLGIDTLFQPDGLGLCPAGSQLPLKALYPLGQRLWASTA